MARIPLGNFEAPVAPEPNVPNAARFAPGGEDPVGRAVEGLGQAVSYAAETVGQVQVQQATEQRRKADAEARAQAGSDLLDHEIAVKGAQLSVQQDIEHGAIPWQDAQDAFTTAVKRVPVPKYTGTDQAAATQFQTGLRSAIANAAFAVRGTAIDARNADFKSQWGNVQQKLGTIAGMPGADGAQLKARLTSFAPLAREAGLSEAQVQADLMQGKSDIDANTAKVAIDQAGADLTTLTTIKNGLSNDKGPWPDLTGSQRAALLTAVDSKLQTLADRAAGAQTRANAAGALAVKQFTNFVSKGNVPGAQYLEATAAAVAGTDSESVFKNALDTYKQVQTVLGMPIAQQQEWMDNAHAALAKQGGNPETTAQLQNTVTAVNANIKALHDDPLQWGPAHGYDAIKPLDFSLLNSDDGVLQLRQQFQHRMTVIDAERSHFGPTVPMKLLEPQEADALRAVLAQATPGNAVGLLATMSKTIADPQVYDAVMNQLAPSNHNLAFFGQLAARDATLTTATHWGPNNDEKISSEQVALTGLTGAHILAGKDKNTYVLPKDADFRKAFSDAVGTLFRDARPRAATDAMNAVKAYYVGKAAEDGNLSDTVDEKALGEAIKVTLGPPANVNGYGEVLPPWGMQPDAFEQAAFNALDREAKAAGLDAQLSDHWDAVGLADAGTQPDGTNGYYVTVPTPNGRRFLNTGKKDANGMPVPFVLTLTPEDSAPRVLTPGQLDKARTSQAELSYKHG